MLKHTVIAALLTLGLAAPAFAQTQTQTPPVTARGQKTARVAPRAKRAARLSPAAADQGRAKLRADLRTSRSQLKALRKSTATASLKQRHQLKREVRTLRLKLNRRHRRGK